MATNTYTKYVLTGGGLGALDAIDGDSLAEAYRAVVITSTKTYHYYLDATSGVVENSPLVIAPDINPGNKRWVLTQSVVSGEFSPSYLAVDQGVTGNSDTIKYLVDTIGSDKATILFKHNSGGIETEYILTTSEIIPANITLTFGPGAFISGAGTLTINSAFQLGNIKAFTCPVAGLGEVNPYWFGAFGDGTTDDAASFQAAHDALKPIGGSYYIPTPSVSFAIGAEIILAKKIHLYGNGEASLIKVIATNMTSLFTFISGSQGSIIELLQLQGGISALGGTIQRAVYLNGAKECTVRNLLITGPAGGTGFNFGVDINGILSGSSKVYNNRFNRLVSAGGNGTAILIEASDFNEVHHNFIDGDAFTALDSPGSAIFLSAAIGGVGSVDNWIAFNIIRNHKQVGIAINSTTKFEFSGNLGACDRNTLEGNDVFGSNNSSGGDASSGIYVIANSSFNKLINNKVHANGHAIGGGYGIVISGSQQGTANPGQPKLDETPNYNEVIGNNIYLNKDTGLRLNGPTNTIVKNNTFYENGQRTVNTFWNLRIVTVGGTSTGDNTEISGNSLIGGQPKYQLEIGAGVSGTIIKGNHLPAAATGSFLDPNTDSLWGENITNIGRLISSTTYFTQVLIGSKVYDAPSRADGEVATTTVTVTGAQVGDLALASLTTLPNTQWIQSAFVSGINTVTVNFLNKTGGVVDLASGTLQAIVIRATN